MSRSHSKPPSPGRQDQTPTHDDHKQRLAEWRDAGNWFLFRRHLLGVCSPTAAILLQHLMNTAGNPRRPRLSPDEPDWILATAEYVQSSLYMTRRVQDRAIAEAVKLGYVETKRAGDDGRRWIRIDLDRVDSDLSRLHRNVQTGCTETRNNKSNPTDYSVTEIHCRPGRARDDGVGGPPMNGIFPALQDVLLVPAPDDFGCADRLHEASVKSGILSRRYNRLKSATHICRLRRQVGTPRLETVFGWFLANYRRDRYVPDARCGKSFAAKFEKIEDARARDLRDNPDVTVSPAAREICSVLRKSKQAWPADLDAAVQLSLTFMEEFCRKLRKPLDDTRADLFRPHLLKCGFREPDSFVGLWFKDRHWVEKKLVPRHVVSADNGDFHLQGRKIAAAWGDEDDWGRLLKGMGYEGGEA